MREKDDPNKQIRTMVAQSAAINKICHKHLWSDRRSIIRKDVEVSNMVTTISFVAPKCNVGFPTLRND